MKNRIFTMALVALASALLGNGVWAQEINRQQGPQFDSPVIATDNTVTFKVHSPGAQTVAINGSWMGWGESTLMARKQLNVRYHATKRKKPDQSPFLFY